MDLISAMDKCLLGNGDEKDIVAVGEAMKEFKKTEFYEMLRRDRLSTIEYLLTMGRQDPKISAEYQLGKLEGINSWETVIDGYISMGENTKKNREKKKSHNP